MPRRRFSLARNDVWLTMLDQEVIPMADKPEAGRLLISQSPGSTRIEGIVGADPNLMALVGTVKEAALIEIDDASKLERAIVEATQSGTRVMDGYVKFAYPIVIKGPTQVTVGDALSLIHISEPTRPY